MTARTYTRRTPEERVAELQAEIERVEARAALKEAKSSPEGKALIAAVRALDKALAAARDAGAEAMLASLDAARATLGEELDRAGIPAPKTRGPRKAKAAKSKKDAA